MKIGLKNSVASLNINTNGAYIDNFEVKGVPIFFPKVMVKIGDILKVRGGMHVCTPNFGLDKRLDTLPAHGFGSSQTVARKLSYTLLFPVCLQLDGSFLAKRSESATFHFFWP